MRQAPRTPHFANAINQELRSRLSTLANASVARRYISECSISANQTGHVGTETPANADLDNL